MKVVQAEIKAAQAEIKAAQAEMEARADERQDKADAKIEARLDQFKEEIKARQEKADAEAKPRHERMEAAMRSMRSDIERSMQKQVEDVLSVVDYKTHSLQLDLTEKFESTQVKLDTIQLALGVETNSLRLDLSTVQAGAISNRQATFERTEAVKRDFHVRLEEAKEMAGHTNGTGNGSCAVTPPKFDGTASWSVFRHQFETVAEHNGWTPKEKSTFLITALEGRATDVLHGISKGTTYEEILQALEDLFAAVYRSQLKVRTQKAGESLQDYATAIQQLARRAYPASPEEHIRREAGKHSLKVYRTMK
jgi:hypothetical protein